VTLKVRSSFRFTVAMGGAVTTWRTVDVRDGDLRRRRAGERVRAVNVML
jgi:hypothetical protein